MGSTLRATQSGRPQGVSSRLSGTVRPGDVIGRLGGDEFTILAEDITPEDALVMAERIQRRWVILPKSAGV